MTVAIGNLRFPEHKRLVSVGKKATGGGSAVLPGTHNQQESGQSPEQVQQDSCP